MKRWSIRKIKTVSVAICLLSIVVGMIIIRKLFNREHNFIAHEVVVKSPFIFPIQNLNVTSDDDELFCEKYSLQPMLTIPRKENVPCKQRNELWNCIGGNTIWALIFIDHRPGERRIIDIERLLPLTDLIVIHDTENADYKWDRIDWRNSYTDKSKKPFTTVLQGHRFSGKYVFLKFIEIFNNFKEELDSILLKFNPFESIYGSHIRILSAATFASDGNILEMGIGNYSTPILHHLIKKHNIRHSVKRSIVSADTDAKWISYFKKLTNSWHQFRFVPVYSDHIGCYSSYNASDHDFDISWSGHFNESVTFDQVVCPRCKKDLPDRILTFLDYEIISFKEDVKIINPPKHNGSYVIFSCSNPKNSYYRYLFYLPITVRSWTRIGYKSIVILTGNTDDWFFKPLLSFVLNSLIKLRASIILFDCPQEYQVMLSQTSRLFIGYLIPLHVTNNDSYILTSDADLLPMSSQPYKLTSHNDSIMSLNAYCCGHFSYNNKEIRILPMSNIGMTLRKWRDIVSDFPSEQKILTTILNLVNYIFNDNSTFFNDWFLDQKLIGILLSKYFEKTQVPFMLRARNVHLDRIDGSNWKVPKNLTNVVDAHLPADWKKNWNFISPLLKLMFHEGDFRKIVHYYHEFLRYL